MDVESAPLWRRAFPLPLSAALSPLRHRHPFVSLARAFHIATAIGYALAPVCLYVLARVLLRRDLSLSSPALRTASSFADLRFPDAMAQYRSAYAHGPWPSWISWPSKKPATPSHYRLCFSPSPRMARALASGIASCSGRVPHQLPGLIGLGFALAGILVARKTPARAPDSLARLMAFRVLDDARILRLFVSSQSHCSPSHSHRRAVEPNHVADPRGRRALPICLSFSRRVRPELA